MRSNYTWYSRIITAIAVGLWTSKEEWHANCRHELSYDRRTIAVDGVVTVLGRLFDYRFQKGKQSSPPMADKRMENDSDWKYFKIKKFYRIILLFGDERILSTSIKKNFIRHVNV